MSVNNVSSQPSLTGYLTYLFTKDPDESSGEKAAKTLGKIPATIGLITTDLVKAPLALLGLGCDCGGKVPPPKPDAGI